MNKKEYMQPTVHVTAIIERNYILAGSDDPDKFRMYYEDEAEEEWEVL